MNYNFHQFKDLEEIKKIEEDMANTQPYLAAYFAQKVLETGEVINDEDIGSIRNGLNAIKLAFYHLTKTYGLVALSYYIDDEEFVEGSEPLADYVSRMRMLYDSTCKDFLLLYYKVYKKNNRNSKMKGIMEAIASLLAPENQVVVNEKGRNKKTDAMSAAISIRNSILGHLNREIDPKVLIDYYWQYRECLAITARHLSFLDGKEQAICYCEDIDEFFPENSSVSILHGASREFMCETNFLDDNNVMSLEGSKLFHRGCDNHTLALEPFFSFLEHGLDGDVDSEKDEYLAYEALGKDQAIFEGIRSRVNHPNHYSKIKTLFQEKGIELVLDIRKYSFSMLAGFSTEATNRVYITDYLNKKYEPELYVERNEIKQELEWFLSSNEPTYVFTGMAGVGKSVFLAHYIDGFLERSSRGHGENHGHRTEMDEAVFFINASSMTHKNDTLFNKLLEGLCLKGEVLNLQSFLVSVDKMVQKHDKKSSVIFIIDAVNEAHQSEELWQEIQDIASMAVSRDGRLIYPWLKIIIAIRDTGIAHIENKIRAKAKTVSKQKATKFVLRPELFFRGLPESENKEVLRYLKRFTGKELQNLLASYLGDSAPIYTSKLGCALSNPLYLNIYQSLPIHQRKHLTDESDILNCWLDWLVGRMSNETTLDFQTIKRRQLIELFNDKIVQTGSTVIHTNDIVEFTSEEKRQAQNRGVNLFIPTAEQLVLEGLLIESGLTYEIKNQLLRGVCLARYFEPNYEENPLKADEIVDYAMLHGDRLTDFSDAFVFLIKKRVARKAYSEVGMIWGKYIESIGFSDQEEYDEIENETQVFTNLWEAVIRNIFTFLDYDNRQELIKNIEKTGVGLILLSGICHRIGHYEQYIHYEQGIEFYEIALSIRKELYEAHEGRVDLAQDYARTCNNLALVLKNMGEEGMQRAIKLYEIALSICKELYEAHEGRIDLAQNYGTTCGNLAGVLINMGEEGMRAIKLYEIALSIRKELYEAHEGRIDLAQDYTTTCNNLASVLKNMGEEGGQRAIKLYEIALSIREELYEAHEGRIDLAQDYTSTCNNLALVLNNMGEEGMQRAIKLYEIALSIDKELYEAHEGRIDLAQNYTTMCNNLANVLKNMGEEGGQRAIKLYEIALTISKELYEAHEGRVDLAQNYGTTCNNLAFVLENKGEEGIHRAIELYEIALSICKELYEAHEGRIDLAKSYGTTCNNLAIVLNNMGEEGMQRAIKLYEIALSIRKELYEANEGRVDLAQTYTTTCGNLALVLNNMGEEGMQRAIKLYEIALTISKELYEAHEGRVDLAQNYGTTCNNLAFVLENKGEEGIQRAIELYEIALSIRKELYEAHEGRIDLAQDYTTTCNNLALVLKNMGEEGIQRALELNEIALTISKELYEAHEGRIDLAQSYGRTCNNLAVVLKNMGKEGMQRAIELYEIALSIRKELYEAHEGRIDLGQSYGTTCNNLAFVLENMGEEGMQRAIKLYEIALSIRKELYEIHEDRMDLAIELTVTEVNVIICYLNSRDSAWYQLYCMSKEHFFQHIDLLKMVIPENVQVIELVSVAKQIKEIMDENEG